MKFTLVVRVFQYRAGGVDGKTVYKTECGGEGALDLTDARAKALAYAKHRVRSTPVWSCDLPRFAVEVAAACDVCKVTGIKPGCTRKKCLACAGTGSTLVEAYELPEVRP